ncbi:FtsH protease activity modulator HflK [Parvibium lacunae]|uniref:Protein HflK n=2 Tax=Parvibium lacunae TaxID=1888893 RepID=A0A368L8H7_9BURK|nr:FtsH protease activity modulator HflK [Parvibium lacunae]
MSLNDPRWGNSGKGSESGESSPEENGASRPQRPERPEPPESRRPGANDGPPDLDELWRDFNRKLNQWLGKGRTGQGSGGTGGFEPSMKGAGIGAGLVLAVVALLWLGSGFFIVQEGQVGVITTFGKYSSTTKAGFQWRMPYPIQAHEVVNISQVRKVEIGYQGDVRTKVGRESLMLTEDENIIDIQFAVQYRLKDAKDYLFNNVKPDEAVKQAAETAMREIVGRSKMDYVLYEGREQIAIQAAQNVQKILDGYKAGILVSNITVQNAQPPEQVQAAFDDAVKAGQDRERAKNEGQAYANDVIPKARGTAARLLEEAEGYKQRVIAQAEGDAIRFKQVLAEYSKAPGVTRDRMYLDTMQQIFANTTKVLVDSKGNNNLLYLPLDKLIQQGAQAVVPSSNSGAPLSDKTVPSNLQSNEIPASNDAMRARDAQRSRDREGR